MGKDWEDSTTATESLKGRGRHSAHEDTRPLRPQNSSPRHCVAQFGRRFPFLLTASPAT